jgi:uncharacterized repeat protein (TIGR01451 family)
LAKDGTCNSFEASSGIWIVSVRPEFNPGEIATTGQTICYDENPVLIGSTTLASGGDNNIEYKWQSSPDGNTWTDIFASDAATYDPPNLTETTYYQRLAKDGTCNGFEASSGIWIVTVRPEFNPGEIAATGQTICYNENPDPIGSTSTASGGDGVIEYKWQSSPEGSTWTDITGSNSENYDPSNLTATTHYRRLAKDGTCNGFEASSGTWVVTVNPIPTVTATPTTQTLCSEETTSINLSGTVANTTFNWTVSVSPAGSVTGASDDSGTSIAQTLTNTTALPATITYTIIPEANGCPGDPIDVTITVNPTPTLSNSLSEAVCSGTPFSYTPTSDTPGTTFSWTRAAVIGIQNTASSGSDPGEIDETLVNTTGTEKVVTYRYTLSANGCTHLEEVTVTVYPAPTLSSSTNPPAVCSNSPFTYNATSNIPGTTFSWSREVVAGISNEANSGEGGSITETLINTTPDEVVVPYTITMEIGGCENTQNVFVTVKPTPVLSTDLLPEPICSGEVFGYEPASETEGTTFTWQRANMAGISPAGNTGTDNPNETLVNSTDGPIDVIYIYTLRANQCAHVEYVIVRVNPTPTVDFIDDMEFCSGTVVSETIVAGPVEGSIFTWTNDNTAIGLAAEGTGNISSFTATNTTGSAISATITITPEANDCSGTPFSYTITVYPESVGGSVGEDAVVCSGSNSGTLTLTGHTGNIIRWESSTDDGTTWTPIANTGTTQTYSNLTTTTWYRAVIKNGACNETYSDPAIITVNPVSVGGLVSGDDTVCEGTNSTELTLSGHIGNITKWQSSTDGGSSWADIVNTATNYIANNLIETTLFRAVVQSDACDEVFSESAEITVDPASIGGTIAGGTTVCAGTNSTDLTLGGHIGDIVKWQFSDDGGASWTDIAHTSATYTATNLSVTTHFRAVVQSGVCSETNSAEAVISVDPASEGGTIEGGTTVCAGTNSTELTLSGHIGDIAKWQFSTNGGSTWTDITNTATIYTANNLTETTLFRAVLQSGVCGEVFSAEAEIVVNPETVGGTVSSDQTICYNSIPDDLSLTGQTGEVIRWEQATDAAFTSPVNINETTATLAGTTIGMLTETTYFRAVVQSGICSEEFSGYVTITVDEQSEGGIAGNDQEICAGDTPESLELTDYSGTIVKWQKADDFAFTSPTDIAETGSTLNAATIGPLTETTYFRAVVQSGVCGEVNSSVAIITVSPYPVVVVTNPPPECIPATVDLTDESIIEGSTLGLTYSYWLDENATVPHPNPETSGKGTFYIKGETTIGCYDIQSVNVSIYSDLGIPVFELDEYSESCAGSEPFIYNVTAENAFTITYSIDAASVSAGNSIDPNTGLLTIDTDFSGTIQITATATGCGPDATAIHSVNVHPSPTVELTASSTTICEGESVVLTATNSGGVGISNYYGESGNVNITIPNNTRTSYANSTILLSGSSGATLEPSDVVIVTLNIPHDWVEDLDIFLIDPTGTRAMLLTSDNGGDNENYTNSVLRTDATNIIGTAGNNTAPFTGTYRPEGTITAPPVRTGAAGGGNYNAVVPVNALNGAPIDGNWTLRVFDDANHTWWFWEYDNRGTLNSWSLQIIKQAGSEYTTTFNGPPVIGEVSYLGLGNTTATTTITPSVGTHVYTATTTDANGCQGTSNSVTITVNPKPEPTIEADYCAIRPKVLLSAEGGYSSYVWNTGETGQSIEVDIAGTYTVTVEDAFGCPGSASIQVAEELVVNGNFSQGNVGFTSEYVYNPDLYPEGRYYVGPDGNNYHGNFWGYDHTAGTGIAPNNFMVVNGWGDWIVWERAGTVNVTPNTDYYFAAWAMSVNQVTPYARLRFEVNGEQVGIESNLGPGPANQSQVNLGNWVRFYGIWPSGSATTATIRIINLEHSLGGNDFGLDDISFGTLANVEFTVDASSNLQELCAGETLELFSDLEGGRSPIDYTWTGPDGVVFSTEPNPVITNVTAENSGTYTVSVVDYYGCDPITASVDITVNATPVIPDQTALICSGETFTVTPVNGDPDENTIVPANTTYTWSAPTGAGFTGGTEETDPQTSISQELTNTTSDPVTATYSVTPVAGDCAGEPFEVVVTINPTAIADAGEDISVCSASPEITLDGSIGGAATSATWSGGLGSFSPDENTLDAVYTLHPDEIAAGTVTLTLTTNDPDDGGPCSAVTDEVMITISQNPVLDLVPTHVACFEESSGEIDLTVTGGTAPFTYVWTASEGGVVPAGQVNSEDLTGLVAGTYSVTVTDDNSCGATAEVILAEPEELIVSEEHTGILCAGLNSDVTVTVTGGTAPYTVSWDGGTQTETIAANGGQAIIQQPEGIVEYTITDAEVCVNTISVEATVAENTPPEITQCPASFEFEGCSTDDILTETGLAYSETEVGITETQFTDAGGVATDNCAVTSWRYIDVVSSEPDACPIVVTRTFIVEDASGLTNETVCGQTITITDNTAPTFTVPGPETVYKDAACNYNISETVTGEPEPSEVVDNCDDDPDVTFTDSEPVEGACFGELIITRTWTVTDNCGNATSQDQIITVSDNTAPTFTAPADITINAENNCGYDAGVGVTGDVTDEADNCDTNMQATYSDDIDNTNPCEIIITRTWSLVDACGNAAGDQVQIITVIDDTPPVFTRPPDTEVYTDPACGYDASPSEAGDVFDETDNCSTGLEVTYSDVLDDTDPCNITITRTWSLADDCGNAAENQVQTILVRDLNAPVITCPPNEAIAYGTDPVPAVTGEATALDDCDNDPNITYSDIIIYGACTGNYEIRRTWTVTDQCGNEDYCTQSIFVQDIELPEITCLVVDNQTVEANSGDQYIHPDGSWDATVVENTGVYTLNATLSGATESGPHENTLENVVFEEGVTNVTWTALDDCGNPATCSFTVTVNASADLSITKTANPETAVTGEELVYTLEVSNAGPSAAQNTVIEDNITVFTNPEYALSTSGPWEPWTGNFTLTNPLAVGETFNLYIRGTVPVDQCEDITNSARVSSDNADYNMEDNEVTLVTPVTDNQPPVISGTLPDFEECVDMLYRAVYDTDDVLRYLDHNGASPDPYLIDNTATEDFFLFISGNPGLDLDLDAIGYTDNCCLPTDDYSVEWTINFDVNTPNIATGTSISSTGQPSTHFSDIKLWGDRVNYTTLHHTITYWIKDCHGNESLPVTRDIYITPRPKITKMP